MKVRASIAREILRLAMGSIWVNKLRTFLTLLGIIMGVASVVIVGAGIRGAQTYVQEQVAKALGSNSFMLTRFSRFGAVSDSDFQEMVRRNPDLKLEDLRFLRQYCSFCSEITAELSTNQTSYGEGKELQGTNIQGTTPNAIFLGDFEVVEGRFFSELESQRSRAVAVIGQDLRDEFFPSVDPVGRTIKIRNQPLRVIGLLERMGSNFGQSQDNLIYIPLSTYRKMFGSRRSIRIRGRAADPEHFDEMMDQARVAMRIQHQLKPNEEDDFGLISTDQINDMVDRFAAIVASVVLPITLISLVVGGIVIMNIMLVSVTERTFEIGIRKALGAKRRDILYQFLIESSLMAGCGGTIGLLLATAVAILVERSMEFPMEVSAGYVVLAVGVSSTVGLISGIYPAFKASKLDPILAMSEGR